MSKLWPAMILTTQLLISGNQAQGTEDIAALRLRLQLAEEGKPFLTLEEGHITVSIRNLDLKVLVLTRTEIIGKRTFRLGRIIGKNPVQNPKDSITYVSEIEPDTLGTVSSLDDIVSLSDQPSAFRLVLHDGSQLLVKPGNRLDLFEEVEFRLLQMRTVYSFLWQRVWGVPSCLVFLELSAESAQQLYWVARVGTGFIL